MAKEILQGTVDQAGIVYDVKLDGGKLIITASVDLVKDVDLVPGSNPIEDMIKGLVKTAILAL